MSGHSKWANIKHKKSKADAEKGKIFTKIGREIVIAVRQGGPDPAGNVRLKMVLQKAREANMPNENIQRAIQKAIGGAEGSNYEEIVYEGYGPGGVAVMLEIATDNRNRTASDMRHIFSRNGGNLGETGCVSWMFNKKGLIIINRTEEKKDEEEILMVVLEAGAEDMRTEEDTFEIITQPEDLETVREALEKNNIKYESAEVTMIPQTTVELRGKEAEQMLKLMDALQDHDDVQEVYANFDIPDEVMEELSNR